MEICAPVPHERVDWDVPSWMSFYEFALEVGFRFHVPKLVREVLGHYEIELTPKLVREVLGHYEIAPC